jgi:hypothetical protein
LTTVELDNALDLGLWIRGRGRQMNSKVGIHTNKAKPFVYWDKEWITSSISMCPWPTSPDPYL